MARGAQREMISGVIQAFNRTGKNFKLDDGEWYSLFNVDQGQGAQVGDSVEFEMEPRESGGQTFLNVKGDVTILEEGGGQRSSGRGGQNEDSPRGSRTSPPRSGGGRSSGQERSSGGRSYGGRGGGSGGGQRSSYGRSGGGSGGGDDARQQSIQRQTAIKAAVDFVAALPPELVQAVKDEVGMDGAVESLVIENAKRFVEFFETGE